MSSQEVTFSSSSLSRRRFIQLGVLTFAAATTGIVGVSNVAQGAQTRVVMKDGRMFVGSIFPAKSVVETTEGKKE